jgi:hypothetical protein
LGLIAGFINTVTKATLSRRGEDDEDAHGG